MQQFDLYIVSLLTIPFDVMQHHLLRFLSRADLVTLSMTCTAMQKLFVRWMLCSDKTKASKAQLQADVFDDIFLRGSFGQLIWFQNTLKYLSLTEMDQKKQVPKAARGLIFHILIFYFLIFF